MYGYARVSSKDQNLLMQLDALQVASCQDIYKEVLSGVQKDRPVLADLLHTVISGDTVIIWKLDRLGRSLKDLLSIMSDLEDKGVYNME